jgi:hypothetical protein
MGRAERNIGPSVQSHHCGYCQACTAPTSQEIAHRLGVVMQIVLTKSDQMLMGAVGGPDLHHLVNGYEDKGDLV